MSLKVNRWLKILILPLKEKKIEDDYAMMCKIKN